MNSLLTGIQLGSPLQQLQEDTDMAKKVKCPKCGKKSKAKDWKFIIGESYQCPKCGAICEDDKSEMK